MEAKRFFKNLFSGEYIGQRLRENGFDPKGKSTSTMLDDLANYDLTISVALWWLSKDDEKNAYPNHLEREAMILSSFAGMLLNSLPIEDILSLYNCKPVASYPHNHGNIVHPFSLSYHPFSMLSSFKAVDHSRKHSMRPYSSPGAPLAILGPMKEYEVGPPTAPNIHYIAQSIGTPPSNEQV
uniref:Uncharacterized protein n=1 Tax=Sinocyclocheilus rhinocerous TaxID=307959 RepID=A0A673HSB2_9TELE